MGELEGLRRRGRWGELGFSPALFFPYLVRQKVANGGDEARRSGRGSSYTSRRFVSADVTRARDTHPYKTEFFQQTTSIFWITEFSNFYMHQVLNLKKLYKWKMCPLESFKQWWKPHGIQTYTTPEIQIWIFRSNSRRTQRTHMYEPSWPNNISMIKPHLVDLKMIFAKTN